MSAVAIAAVALPYVLDIGVPLIRSLIRGAEQSVPKRKEGSVRREVVRSGYRSAIQALIASGKINEEVGAVLKEGADRWLEWQFAEMDAAGEVNQHTAPAAANPTGASNPVAIESVARVFPGGRVEIYIPEGQLA